MKRSEALARLHEITQGIGDSETDAGWWETSVGAEFGRERLRQLEDLVEALTA